MSESLQLAVETQIEMNWNYYVQLVESTIVIYDYLLTFDAEVERYWKQKTRFTFATTLFYFYSASYDVLLSMFITGVIFFWFRPSSTVCVAGNSFVSKMRAIHGGIGTIVMRDGTMYFGIVTLINSANITLFFTVGKLPFTFSNL
ncbi:uncharacterized protein C8R40DRAFT_1073878 [Lentinula edodes]|uniref:uncharacterized protein n=1 Tax=Lentinula edodes TaxID=5353 RepID=UPI001E8CE6A8|nr:uncharacterized protein C8R40DRAFT_1073878 [Lentinula edodes]KAH7869758.1 hypothetical protein C8R40DRAFT_1073878 [Lentinula edodes]